MIGDFVTVLVFVWVYDRVRWSRAGVKGGASYALYAGILINFPTWIFAHLLFEGFPYSLAWTWTLVGIGWCVIEARSPECSTKEVKLSGRLRLARRRALADVAVSRGTRVA